jgi:6,7-dimethyl-8-ribityllumazine synthase
MAGPRQAKSKSEGATSEAALSARILVVEGRYYEAIADALLAGTKRALEQAKVEWDLVTVPGALEVPQAIAIALDAAQRRRRPFDGVVALGCVIRGETSHYDIVAGESARALMDVAIARKVPAGNGILTVDTEAQALARAEAHDKGGTAAQAALALIRLKRAFAKRSPAKRSPSKPGARR